MCVVVFCWCHVVRPTTKNTDMRKLINPVWHGGYFYILHDYRTFYFLLTHMSFWLQKAHYLDCQK